MPATHTADRQLSSPKTAKKPFSLPQSVSLSLLYAQRACKLQCPLCGNAPIFSPFYEFNGLLSWFRTLSRCSSCGCNYHRESGYFLIVAWLINVEVCTIFAMLGFVILDWLIGLSFLGLVFFNTILVLVVCLVSIRHGKAFFIAFDYLIDPPRPSED